MRSILRDINVNIENEFKNAFGEISITASIGAACYPQNGENTQELFKKCDFCLYRAKDKGRNRYVFFRDDLHGELFKEAESVGGIKYNDRETQELKMMSEFMQNLGVSTYSSIKTILNHMLKTYNLDTINIYYGEEMNRVYHVGQKSEALENASYVYSQEFAKALNGKSLIRIDFTTEATAETKDFVKIAAKKGIKSTIQCILGTPNNITGLITFDKLKEGALFAEYEVNCCSLFASAINLLPEATKVDFALYSKLKYSI